MNGLPQPLDDTLRSLAAEITTDRVLGGRNVLVALWWGVVKALVQGHVRQFHA